MRFWDFLFYASFGFVVTSSVAIAGVLLVFCYLIVPSVARCSSPTASARGWPSAGPWALWSPRSACISRVKLDLPTGATIVCTFGGVLVLMFLVYLILYHRRAARGLEGAASVPRERDVLKV